ncbi:MAG: class I SAM-dependent methyltransferase [Acidobacteriota bacterium]
MAKRREGWHGWDDYAAFYDWENARTLGRRDLPFWRRTLAPVRGRTLELGCGTGRLLIPLARAGLAMVGIDRSAPMLARAVTRSRRLARPARPLLLRGDIRHLPFADRSFGAVMAPYGLCQSLLNDDDLRAVLAEARRVLRRGGLLGIDLVPDLPAWREYSGKISLRGRGPRGGAVTLIETVRQDRRRRLTIFDEVFVETIGGRSSRHAFTLTFRTLSLPEMVERVAQAGFVVDHLFGDYRGGPWHDDADVWLIVARRR